MKPGEIIGNLFRILPLKPDLGAMMDRPEFPSDVSREQFELVRPMLEAARRRTRPRKHDLYDVFCAVLYFLDSGAAWRSLPPAFPPWRTVHEYFTQWSLSRGDEPSLLERALETIGRPVAIEQMRKRVGDRGP